MKPLDTGFYRFHFITGQGHMPVQVYRDQQTNRLLFRTFGGTPWQVDKSESVGRWGKRIDMDAT